MRKKGRTTFMAVVGVAVLAAAVAFMPACDTGESCDLDLEILNGKWFIEVDPEKDDPFVQIIEFKASDGSLIRDGYAAPVAYNLFCGGEDVTIRGSELIPASAFKEMFPDSDCNVTVTTYEHVTFISPDEFAGTRRETVSFIGDNCAEVESYFIMRYGADNTITGEVTWTRDEN